MITITFYNWIIEQKYRDDQIGELARLFTSADHLPEKKTKRTLLSFILTQDEDPMYLYIYDLAWNEYREFRNKVLK